MFLQYKKAAYLTRIYSSLLLNMIYDLRDWLVQTHFCNYIKLSLTNEFFMYSDKLSLKYMILTVYLKITLCVFRKFPFQLHSAFLRLSQKFYIYRNRSIYNELFISLKKMSYSFFQIIE